MLPVVSFSTCYSRLRRSAVAEQEALGTKGVHQNILEALSRFELRWGFLDIKVTC